MVVGYTIADKQEDGTWRVGFWKVFMIGDGESSAIAYGKAAEALKAIQTPHVTVSTSDTKIVTVMVPDEELAS
jgi:hypothetical protein